MILQALSLAPWQGYLGHIHSKRHLSSALRLLTDLKKTGRHNKQRNNDDYNEDDDETECKL